MCITLMIKAREGHFLYYIYDCCYIEMLNFESAVVLTNCRSTLPNLMWPRIIFIFTNIFEQAKDKYSTKQHNGHCLLFPLLDRSENQK